VILKEMSGEVQRSLSFTKRQLPLFFSITTQPLLLMQIEKEDGMRRSVNNDDAVHKGNPVWRIQRLKANLLPFGCRGRPSRPLGRPNRSNGTPYLRESVAVGPIAARTYSRAAMVEDRTIELDGSVRGRRRW